MSSKADKLHKKAVRDQQKRMKPGECEKYVRLVLDDELISCQRDGLGYQLLIELQRLGLKYEFRRQPIKMSITWERQAEQHELNAGETVASSSNEPLTAAWQAEPQVLQMILEQDLQNVEKHSQINKIPQHLQKVYPNGKHYLVVLHKKQNKTNSQSKSLNKALMELQLLHQTASLQVPADCSEVAAMLRRFTKAIAETPYKQQKATTLHTFKKYLANDKKQCVRVVGTYGLGRLWQQHLNRLPLVTLEVAESIIAQYPCPKKLIDAFERDADTEMQKLADVKISRSGPQPLQTDRRIGIVLSSKLHLLYTSRDPNAIL